jgi:hypothetical protein
MPRLMLVVLLTLVATSPMLAAENPVLQGSVERIASDAWTAVSTQSLS